jgi:hypothetical protein
MAFIKNPTPEQLAAVEALVSPGKRAEIQGLVKALAPVIGDYVQNAINKTCTPLHDRIKQLEERPDLKYLGVWRQDQVYGSGNFVTDGGSVWHAQRASVGERPGCGDAWALAVKKGRDAR